MSVKCCRPIFFKPIWQFGSLTKHRQTDRHTDTQTRFQCTDLAHYAHPLPPVLRRHPLRGPRRGASQARHPQQSHPGRGKNPMVYQASASPLGVAKNEHRSALHGTSRFGFTRASDALNIGVCLLKHKERARVSPLRFLWALIEQRKRNNLLCESGGSVAVFGLVLGRCARCSVVLGAVQRSALCSAARCMVLRAVYALC